MHGVRRSILDAQVKELALPLFEATIPPEASNAIYEEALMLALKMVRLQWPDVQHLAFGDLFLTDVRAYRERLLDRLGWAPLFPLWGQDTGRLAREFISRGFRAILTCVDTTQLGPEFAGREFDEQLLADLPESVDPCGERGEFHTLSYAGPLFAEPLRLERGASSLRDNRFQYTDFTLICDRP